MQLKQFAAAYSNSIQISSTSHAQRQSGSASEPVARLAAAAGGSSGAAGAPRTRSHAAHGHRTVRTRLDGRCLPPPHRATWYSNLAVQAGILAGERLHVCHLWRVPRDRRVLRAQVHQVPASVQPRS